MFRTINNYFQLSILTGAMLLGQAGQCQAESVFVALKGSHEAALIDVDSQAIKRFSVGYLPHEVGAAGGNLFVSNYGVQHVRSTSLSNRPGNTLTMIQRNDPKITREIDLSQGHCAPHGIKATPDQQRLFVTCEGRQEIAVIEAETGRVLRFLRTNQSGSHMLTASNDQLFVANFWIGTVSVIDIESGKIQHQIRTGRTTEGITLSPDFKTLYVTVVESNELVKVDVSTGQILLRKQLADRTSPIRIEFVTAAKVLVVTQTGRNSLGVYDVDSLEAINEIPVGRQPIGLAISNKWNRAYVANMKDGSLSVVDLAKMDLVKTMNLDLKKPDGLVVLED